MLCPATMQSPMSRRSSMDDGDLDAEDLGNDSDWYDCLCPLLEMCSH